VDFYSKFFRRELGFFREFQDLTAAKAASQCIVQKAKHRKGVNSPLDSIKNVPTLQDCAYPSIWVPN